MKVEIVPYNPEWKKIYEGEKPLIAVALDEFAPVIEHIGSTSVEGLGAKPVIDIMIGMHKYSDLDASVEKMISAGYVYAKKYEDQLPDRRYFFKIENQNNDVLPEVLYNYGDKIDRLKYPHTYHIHMVELNSPWWVRHIAFRDFLRKNSEMRDQYYKVKMQLAEQDWDDTNDYAQAKTDFIRSIEKKAGIKHE